METKRFTGAALVARWGKRRLSAREAVMVLGPLVPTLTGSENDAGLVLSRIFTALIDAAPNAQVVVCTDEEIVEARVGTEPGKAEIYLVGKDGQLRLPPAE